MNKLKIRFMVIVLWLLVQISEAVAFNWTVQTRPKAKELIKDLENELDKE